MEFDLVPVGFLKKTFGKDGGLKVELYELIFEKIEPGMFLFIDLDGDQVPFEVTGLEIKSDVIIYFDEITTPEEATPLTGRDLFMEKKHLDSGLLQAISESDLEFGFLTGYLLFHPLKGRIGTIQAVEAFPQQEMAVIVTSKKNKILIPLNPALITELNENKKEVVVNFPQELLNL